MAVRRTLIAVGIVGAGLFLAVPAQASGPPVGSCPHGYTLASASILPKADLNGDGLICGKRLTPTDQPFGPNFSNFIDNIVQG
jgi:hypothetical protein